MLKIYDKAQWHIDADSDPEKVVRKMRALLHFLNEKKLLSEEGREILEFGVDSSVSINERMLTKQGNKFMEEIYDSVINSEGEEFSEKLQKEFEKFSDKY